VLYNSFQFLLVFLPLCLLLYFAAAKISSGLANVVLAVMSLIFYAWWNPWNLLVIAISIAANFSIGLALRRGETKHKRLILALGIAANLAALAFFKYTNFAVGNWNVLTNNHLRPLQIALPLGISFFTFTQIAFLVDASRGQTTELGLLRYILFVTFFPHLIAGPIVHHSQLMPQFAEPGAKKWIPANIHIGIAFVTIGLFNKVIIADNLAPWANQVFDARQAVSTLDAWRGALAYTMQLYFDFSGYCDMAIGLAMLFNIRLPDNFNNPYQAETLADFWRRWHMTLSQFLRDYLYIPLGGNRKGEPRREFNVMTTMLLGGIWHGAGWTYAIWGLFHGILLVMNHAWSRLKVPMPKLGARTLTFIAVVTGWVIFRAANPHIAGSRLKSMYARNSGISLVSRNVAVAQFAVLAGLLLLVNLAPNAKQWTESRPLNKKRAILLGILFFISLLQMCSTYTTHAPQPFIYFQF
jgi:D-alanyl-lipoteichoic acid acyltransferase DltB (MBOAT superfamily)